MNDNTHRFIIAKAVELFGREIPKINQEILLEYCVKPDYDENQRGYVFHFFNPATKRNYKGERMSALTKYIEHFENAIKNNDLKELGRSIHFLTDLCTPVHCGYEDNFDSAYRLKQHIEFENLCDKLIKVSNIDLEEINNEYYIANNLKTIGKSCAMVSSLYFSELDKNPKLREEVGIKSIMNAIKASQGILCRFFASKRGEFND